MADWNHLRRLDDQVSPPPFESLVTAAGRRDRRARAAGIAAALVVTIGLGVGASMWDRDSDDLRPVDDPTPTPSEAVLSLPEARSDGAIPPLDAGRYRVPLGEGLTYDIDLTEGALLSTKDPYLDLGDDILKIELAGEGFGVAPDPCRGQTELTPVEHDVPAVIAAIRRQPAYDVTDLGDVAFGGATGRQIRISIPPGYDAAGCPDEQVGLPGNPGTVNNMEPGYAGDWWILDVSGRLVVAHHYCDLCQDGAREDISAMIRGITFTPTD